MDQFGCPNARDPNSSSAGQGGPPDGTFKNLVSGATESRTRGGNIKDENISKDSNAAGTLSMANTGQPNSGGSQFFLNVANNANLDWFSGGQSKHPVFGKIIDNYDLCVEICKCASPHLAPLPPSATTCHPRFHTSIGPSACRGPLNAFFFAQGEDP